MEREDDQLIAMYRSGDMDALGVLIEKYLQSIYTFTKRLTGRSEDAQDITQETFVKVWRTLDRYKTGKSFKTWLFTIARNTAIDHLRKKRMPAFSEFNDAEGKNPLIETLADTGDTPAERAVRQDEERVLEEALITLSPVDREIMHLHYHQDMTFDAIGRMQNKPLDTVKSRHRRALQKMREYFEKWYR